MRRRPVASDPGFGSDSFLDVLSNIVGILIILIVMAGMQLGRLPLNPGPATAEPTATPVAAATVPATSPAPSTPPPGAGGGPPAGAPDLAPPRPPRRRTPRVGRG
jgi:hypothetical protein